ncbi:MAG: hypothetical protein EWM72_02934 [Nitrospira sp.]|nr:MAG: hypothetical protein EWM72_02934 [Nitrospira sp.]
MRRTGLLRGRAGLFQAPCHRVQAQLSFNWLHQKCLQTGHTPIHSSGLVRPPFAERLR